MVFETELDILNTHTRLIILQFCWQTPVDQEGQQGKTELITLTCRLSEKEKKGKWYLRNAATFKDIRAGENGLELIKGNMPGHEDKYDWSFKDDTYTLHIKNPTVEEDGTYNLVIRELDNMKTGAFVTVKAADPEYYFKKFLKEKEKGLTARPLKLICHLNVPNAPLKVTKWLKNGSPLQVSQTNRSDKLKQTRKILEKLRFLVSTRRENSAC